MRVGGQDGRESVYKVVMKPDFQDLTAIFAGDIILERGESLKAVVPDMSFSLLAGWRRFLIGKFGITMNGELIPFTDESGTGSLYITDRRLLFLRRPDLRSLYKHYTNANSSPPIALLKWVGEITKTNSLEYCEVRVEDIIRYKEHREGGTLYIDLGTDKFHLFLGEESWQIVGPMLKARRIMSDAGAGS
jgi:hypothetical protein